MSKRHLAVAVLAVLLAAVGGFFVGARFSGRYTIAHGVVLDTWTGETRSIRSAGPRSRSVDELLAEYRAKHPPSAGGDDGWEPMPSPAISPQTP